MWVQYPKLTPTATLISVVCAGRRGRTGKDRRGTGWRAQTAEPQGTRNTQTGTREPQNVELHIPKVARVGGRQRTSQLPHREQVSLGSSQKTTPRLSHAKRAGATLSPTCEFVTTNNKLCMPLENSPRFIILSVEFGCIRMQGIRAQDELGCWIRNPG